MLIRFSKSKNDFFFKRGNIFLKNNLIFFLIEKIFSMTNFPSALNVKKCRKNFLEKYFSCNKQSHVAFIFICFQDELMSNEQLFFGLSQVLRKFPKDTGK